MLQCRCLNENFAWFVWFMHIQSSFYLLLLILNKQGSLLQHVDKFSSVLQTLVSMFNVYFFSKQEKWFGMHIVYCVNSLALILCSFFSLSSPSFQRILRKRKIKNCWNRILNIDSFCKICSLIHLLSTHTRNHCNFLRM